MHITLETDYAIRIVYSLAKRLKRADAKTVAEQTGVPLRFALKIFRKLVAGQIVVSFKGSQGGYQLARDAAEISVFDVVQAVNGPFLFCRCLDDSYGCSRKDQTYCPFHALFDQITKDTVARMQAKTFAQALLEEQRETQGKM